MYYDITNSVFLRPKWKVVLRDSQHLKKLLIMPDQIIICLEALEAINHFKNPIMESITIIYLETQLLWKG